MGRWSAGRKAFAAGTAVFAVVLVFHLLFTPQEQPRPTQIPRLNSDDARADFAHYWRPEEPQAVREEEVRQANTERHASGAPREPQATVDIGDQKEEEQAREASFEPYEPNELPDWKIEGYLPAEPGARTGADDRALPVVTIEGEEEEEERGGYGQELSSALAFDRPHVEDAPTTAEGYVTADQFSAVAEFEREEEEVTVFEEIEQEHEELVALELQDELEEEEWELEDAQEETNVWEPEATVETAMHEEGMSHSHSEAHSEASAGLLPYLQEFEAVLQGHAAEIAGQQIVGGAPVPVVHPVPGIEVPLAYCASLGPKQTHLCYHAVGNLLAEFGSTVPEACLTASFSQGCLHGFSERWFELSSGLSGADMTAAEKADRVSLVCDQLPPDSIGDCVHAAAHFLLAELHTAAAVMEVCGRMEDGHRVTCASGTYMLGGPPIYTTDDAIVTPCLTADVPWECFRYGAIKGKMKGKFQPYQLFTACQHLAKDGVANHLVRACYFALGEVAQFPRNGGFTNREARHLAMIIRNDDAIATALFFGGHRTLAHEPDLRLDSEGFCRSKLKFYGLLSPDYAARCAEILELPVHCQYCHDMHSLFYPPGGLPTLGDY